MILKNISFKNYGEITFRFEFNSSVYLLDPVKYFSDIRNILYEGIPNKFKISDFELSDISDFFKLFDLNSAEIKCKALFNLKNNEHSVIHSSCVNESVSIDIYQWSIKKRIVLESFHINNKNSSFTKMFFDIFCFCRIQIIPNDNKAFAINKNGISVICKFSGKFLDIYIIYDQISLSDFFIKNSLVKYY